MIFIFGKEHYFNNGTNKRLTKCPWCGKGNRFKSITNNKEGLRVYYCNECEEFYPENIPEDVYYNQKHTEESMGKANFKVGQAVIADGKEGYEIVKLMNLSAKVKDSSGKTKIFPYALLNPVGGGKKSGGNNSKKSKATVSKSTKSKSKPKPKPKKPAYTASDEEQEDSINDDTPPEIPKKKYKRSVGDNVSDLLTKAGTPTKMIDAVKKHKAYKFINTDSFKNTVALKNELSSGLFKMRIANLLRAAIRRSEK